MKYIVIVIQCFLLAQQAKPFDNFSTGSRSASMGGASVMNPDVWSAQNNQAATAFYNSFALGMHHENRFIVPEYAYQAAHLTIPAGQGAFALTYTYFGYKLFNNKKIGFAYSRKLLDKFAAGIQMDMLHTFIANYGGRAVLCAEAGLYSEPVENLMIGFHIFNVFQARYTRNSFDPVPTVLRMGAGYRFGDKFLLTVESEKDLDNPMVYKAGGEYHALLGLYIMAGVYSSPGSYTFGLGYVYERVRADIGFMNHPELGFTPHFSMSYVFKN